MSIVLLTVVLAVVALIKRTANLAPSRGEVKNFKYK